MKTSFLTTISWIENGLVDVDHRQPKDIKLKVRKQPKKHRQYPDITISSADVGKEKFKILQQRIHDYIWMIM